MRRILMSELLKISGSQYQPSISDIFFVPTVGPNIPHNGPVQVIGLGNNSGAGGFVGTTISMTDSTDLGIIYGGNTNQGLSFVSANIYTNW